MDRSRFFARQAPLVALVVLAIVAGYQHRASVGPWLARYGLALVGVVALLAAPFALLLVDTARFIGRRTAPLAGGSGRSLAGLAAFGLSCYAYLVVVAPGRYPHV